MLVTVPRSLEESVEREREEARSLALNLCHAKMILGTFALFCFWAAYGWTIIFTVMTLTGGWLGRQHLLSLQTMQTEDCCCGPIGALQNLYHMSIINIVLGVFAVLSGSFAAADYTGVIRVFAIIFTILAVFISGVEAWSAVPLRALHQYALLDPVILNRDPAIRSIQVQQSQQPGYSPQYAQPQQGQPVYGYPVQQDASGYAQQPQQPQYQQDPQYQQQPQHPASYPPTGYPQSQEPAQLGYPSYPPAQNSGAPPPPPQNPTYSPQQQA